MTESSVTLNNGIGGDSVRTETVTPSAGTAVKQQVVTLADSMAPDNLLHIDGTGAARSADEELRELLHQILGELRLIRTVLSDLNDSDTNEYQMEALL